MASDWAVDLKEHFVAGDDVLSWAWDDTRRVALWVPPDDWQPAERLAIMSDRIDPPALWSPSRARRAHHLSYYMTYELADKIHHPSGETFVYAMMGHRPGEMRHRPLCWRWDLRVWIPGR